MKTLLPLLLTFCLLAGGCLAADIVTTDSGIPPSLAFYLVKDNENQTELRVAETAHMKLGIHLPLGANAINVELFTPDNETTLAVVCDPKVTSVGSNLAGVTTSFTPTLDAKDSTTNYDRAVLDFGTITNSGTDTVSSEASLLVVEWDAIMLNTPRSELDGTSIWVSAGAEFNNQTEIWVGQHSFIANLSANFTPTESVSVNMTCPDTIEVGTSASVSLDVYLPATTSDVIVDVIIPTNGSGILSVCSIVLTGLGNNYKCFGKDSLNHTVTASSSGQGNDRAQLVTGTMTNANARETTPFADSVVTFQFTIYLYENSTIGDLYQIGATVRIGNDAIWAGLADVTTAAKTPAPNMTATPTFSLTNQGSPTLGEGQGTILKLDINTPANTEGDYVLEVLTPVNDTARMAICLIRVTYIGLNMPCVIESEPVYSSRVGINSTYDRVVHTLGKIANYGYRSDGDSNRITIEIVVKMLNHTLNQDGVQAYVSAGVQLSEGRIWVGQEAITVSTSDTSLEQPTFSLTHGFGSGAVHVGASTYIIVEMTVPPGAVYLPMDVEFLMPTYQNDTALFSLCRVELYHVGSNIPCLNQATANASITYIQGVDGKNYRAVVTLGGVNNVAPNGTAVSSDDVIRFGLTVRVEDHISWVNGSTDWVAIGMMYTTERLWVGQIQVQVLMDDTANSPQSGTLYAELENSTQVANQGASISSNMYIKIPSASTFKLAVSVATTCSGLSICALYVAEVGTNLPCITTPIIGNVTWDTTKTLGESVLLEMGYVTNVHLTEAVETNATFDNNTIRVGLAGRLLTTATIGSCQVTWTVSVDGQDTAYPQTVDVQATSTSTNVSDTLPAFNYYMAALEENATEPTGEISPGESVLVRLDITPNDYISNDLTVKFMAPSNSTQPMEVCGVNVVHTGANVPCLQRGAITATMTSRNNDQVNDVGTLALGSVCSFPLKSDNHSKVVTVEGVVRLRPEAGLSAGDTFWVSVTVNVDSNVIFVAQLLLTVAANFTEGFFNSTDLAVPPAVSLENVSPGPIPMSPSDTTCMTYVITFPPNKTVLAATDISLPFNESACFTVVSYNVTGVGANLGCGAASASTYTNITYTSTDSSELRQIDGSYLDLGIVTNSGMTYRTESAEEADNQLNITVCIQLADCASAEHQAELWPSMAAKVGSVIVVLDKAVTVIRTGTEIFKPSLESSLVDATRTYSNGDTIEVWGCLKHGEASNAEGRDVKVNYYLPPYLTFDGLTSSNGTTPIVVPLSDATGVSLTWDDVFFVDHLCFNVTLSVNMTVGTAAPPSGASPRATTPFQASATVRHWSVSTYSDSQLFYSRMSFLPINITGGCSKGCPLSSPAGALIKNGISDCQLTSSAPPATVSDLRTDTPSYWKPVVRCSGYPVFLQFNFGNLTRITGVLMVQEISSGYSHIQQYQLKYKNRGDSWTVGELVTGVTVNHNHGLSCPVEARQVRLDMDMASMASTNKRLGLRVELQGCPTSTDTPADFCTSTDSCKPTIPSLDVQPELKVRTFLVIPGDMAFICDTVPSKTSWMYPGGDYICYKTQGCSNNQWTRLGEVMNILGFDPNENVLYGIGHYQRSFLMSKDYGDNWFSIKASTYTTAKTESGFIVSKEVEMLPVASIDASTYTFGTWNARYDGVYCNTNTRILDWCFV